MEIEKHIKNLEEYCKVDNLFEKDGDFKEFCDNHIADIKAVIQELRITQSDLYEANHRIADLLLILGDKDRMINEMAKYVDILSGYDRQRILEEMDKQIDEIKHSKGYKKEIERLQRRIDYIQSLDDCNEEFEL